MNEKEIGKVIHFFDHLMVAVVRLDDDLSLGDKIKFVHHDSGFEQTVDSMEIDHKHIESAKAGDEVAIKVSQNTHEHAVVYKIFE